ncbi:MAG: AMP-binding protein, partial [Caulobacteraceae bacterium]
MWNYADIWESIAQAIPDQPAQIKGERRVSWAEFDRRADALARRLLDLGLKRDSKVAAYLYNCPEYLETYYAAFKGGFTPVNTNYRYVADELIYLFDNADAEAVVFDAAFAATVDQIRARLPKVRAWIALAAPGVPAPPFAENYDTVVAERGGRAMPPWGRSGEDILILYTGGTTGMPKGVMWRLDDLFQVLGGGGNLVMGLPPISRPEEAAERVAAALNGGDPTFAPQTTVAAAPLMHGTSQFTGIMALTNGGAVASLPSISFSAVELWSEVERLRAGAISIVGMAFAQPMLEALDAEPGRWDLSSLRRIGSSGTVWS